MSGETTSSTPDGAARTFAASYVSFLYGLGAAASVTPVAHGLHEELLGARSITTPAELTRAVLVRELTVSPDTGATATASAVVDDEASPPYAFSFTLSFSHGRWRVTAVQRSAQ